MEQQLRNIAGLVCRGEATKEHEKFIVASYAKVFKRPFNKCRCQLCDAIFLIIKNLDKMECKFKLKRGIVLVRFGSPIRITHKNLTNENATEHLKARPQDAKFFDYIPAEVLKMIKKDEPVKEIVNVVTNIQPEIVRVELEKPEPVKEPVKKPIQKRTRKPRTKR